MLSDTVRRDGSTVPAGHSQIIEASTRAMGLVGATLFWPEAVFHYCDTIVTPKNEDYNVRYQSSHNAFAFMGLGLSQNHVMENVDLSLFITYEGIERKFYTCKPFPVRTSALKNRKHRTNEGHDS